MVKRGLWSSQISTAPVRTRATEVALSFDSGLDLWIEKQETNKEIQKESVAIVIKALLSSSFHVF